MKTCFCEECNALVSYRVEVPIKEEITVKDKTFTVLQQHAFCDQCGAEVYPSEVVDFCVREAHDGYRMAVGTIPVKRMEELLEKYNIGKGPLSRILGWGPNTIAREMKHCIPNKEHANRLESLFDPENMKILLEKNHACITDVAYTKSMERVRLAMNRCDSIVHDQDNFVKMTTSTTLNYTCDWDEFMRSVDFGIPHVAMQSSVETNSSSEESIDCRILANAA